MKRRPQAFILALSLLLCVLLLVLGVGFLGKRAAQSAATASEALALRARALAEAGLEDCRVKLEKDMFFPPPGDEEQLIFSYSEPVYSLLDGSLEGLYMVTLDLTRRSAPDPPDPIFPSVIHVTSTGSLGDDADHPRAVVTLRMEVDLDEGKRSPTVTDPFYPMRITDWSDEVLPDV